MTNKTKYAIIKIQKRDAKEVNHMTTYTITTINNGKIRNITTTGENALYSKVAELTEKGIIIMEVRTEDNKRVCL